MICVKCSEDKSEEMFYRNKSRANGFDQYCKVCRNSYTKSWSKTEVGKATRRKARQSFYRNNKDYELAKSRQWRGGKKQGTPPWLTEEQLLEIQMIYALARDCKVVTGEPYEVDHIVPIRGKSICGLHVPWNLQVLPADLNRGKGNKHTQVQPSA